MALWGYDCVFCGWNKFHPYNIKRAYGSISLTDEIATKKSRRDGSSCSCVQL